MSIQTVISTLEKARDIGIYGGSERCIELVKQAIDELKIQQDKENRLVNALAVCRDAFDAPKPGAEGGQEWACAMGDPESVPLFVQKMVTLGKTTKNHEQWLQTACDNIEQALLNHRMSHLREESDESSGFPLLDHLSTGNSTQTGKDEIEAMVESIYFALRKTPNSVVEPVTLPSIDEIAQQIRIIDGNHTMGAGAIAEQLHEWLSKTLSQSLEQPPTNSPQTF